MDSEVLFHVCLLVPYLFHSCSASRRTGPGVRAAPFFIALGIKRLRTRGKKAGFDVCFPIIYPTMDKIQVPILAKPAFIRFSADSASRRNPPLIPADPPCLRRIRHRHSRQLKNSDRMSMVSGFNHRRMGKENNAGRFERNSRLFLCRSASPALLERDERIRRAADMRTEYMQAEAGVSSAG